MTRSLAFGVPVTLWTVFAACAAGDDVPLLGMSVSGSVVGADGKGRASYSVIANCVNPTLGTVVQSALSDGRGHFVVRGIPAGVCTFTVEDPAGKGFWTDDPDDLLNRNNMELTIPEGRNVTGIVLYAPAAESLVLSPGPLTAAGTRGALTTETSATAQAVPSPPAPPCGTTCIIPVVTGVGGLQFDRVAQFSIVSDATNIQCRGPNKAGCTRSKLPWGGEPPCSLLPRSVEYRTTIELHGAGWPAFRPDPLSCSLPCGTGSYSFCMAAAHECAHRLENEKLVKTYYTQYMQKLQNIAGACNGCPCSEKDRQELRAFQEFVKNVRAINTETQAQQAGCRYLANNCVRP